MTTFLYVLEQIALKMIVMLDIVFQQKCVNLYINSVICGFCFDFAKNPHLLRQCNLGLSIVSTVYVFGYEEKFVVVCKPIILNAFLGLLKAAFKDLSVS